MSNLRTFRRLPALPEPTFLTDWRVSLIVPYARTNLVTNPSLELATTGWSAMAGSVARSTTYSFHGAYSLAVTPTAATTDGCYFGTVSLTSGTTYAASVKVLVPNAAGRRYRLAIATTAGATLAETSFIATGRWQWVTVFYTETSSTTRRVYITKNGGTETAVFYVDGLQVEACGSEGVFATTYIDGDQQGLLGAVELFPAPYQWNGAPHASTSTRSQQTRAGGRVVPLSFYGFALTRIQGLGMAPLDLSVTPYSQLDGSVFLQNRKAQRTVVLEGRWTGGTPNRVRRDQAALMADLDRDRVGRSQPLCLAIERIDCGVPLGAPAIIPSTVYVGGLEGQVTDLPAEQSVIQFTQLNPILDARDGGAATDPYDQITTDRGPWVRSPTTGQWSTIGGSFGVSNGVSAWSVLAMVAGTDGTVYFGGAFTSVSGFGTAQYVAAYNPFTAAVSNVGSSTALNGQVNDLKIGPADGKLYLAGAFTDAGGNVNADAIATWDGSTWGNLSSGANAAITQILFGPDGTLYAIGNFTTIGGSGINWLAKWNGSTWTALGSGVNSQPTAMAMGNDRYLYVAGPFTSAGGVAGADGIARYNTATGTWAQAGGVGVIGTINAMACLADGTVVAAGNHTQIAGVTVRGLSAWNGTTWVQLGGSNVTGFNYRSIYEHPSGDVYLGLSATATSWQGTTPPESCILVARQTLVAGPVEMASTTAWVACFLYTNSYFFAGGRNGVSTAITNSFAGCVTVTNPGSLDAYPTFFIQTSASGYLLSIENLTTGKRVTFNFFVLTTETITIVCDPTRLSITSSTRGNQLSGLAAGGSLADLVLQPGANLIAIRADRSNFSGWLQYPVLLEDPAEVMKLP